MLHTIIYVICFALQLTFTQPFIPSRKHQSILIFLCVTKLSQYFPQNNPIDCMKSLCQNNKDFVKKTIHSSMHFAWRNILSIARWLLKSDIENLGAFPYEYVGAFSSTLSSIKPCHIEAETTYLCNYSEYLYHQKYRSNLLPLRHHASLPE